MEDAGRVVVAGGGGRREEAGSFAVLRNDKQRDRQRRNTEILSFAQNDGERQRQQVPSLRCGMTSNGTGNGRSDKQRDRQRRGRQAKEKATE